ncbi:MAG: hypothetical protein ACI4NO_05390 [Oxalobacter sp.]
MKKLSIALLSTFTASIPSYAQSGVIDAIIETETVQVTQNVNDMLGNDGGDYGYYDSYDYGHGDYRLRFSHSDYRYPPNGPRGGHGGRH